MMTDLEHLLAVYYDVQGERHEIKAEELNDRATLELAKLADLLDESEQVSLSPRIVKDKRSHFVAPASSVKRRVLAGPKDPAHDKRIETLLDDLKAGERWKIETRRYVDKELIATILFDLFADYTWDKEVHRIVTADTIVRHDLFGQANQLKMSMRRPWIAVEVINTHYPEEVAFQEMLRLSRAMPLLVAFDFIERPNYFFKVDLRSATIVTRVYIHDGCVWTGGAQTGIASSSGLEIFINQEIGHLKQIDAWKEKKAAEVKARRP